MPLYKSGTPNISHIQKIGTARDQYLRNKIQSILILFMTFVLAACGGSGSSSSSNAPLVPNTATLLSITVTPASANVAAGLTQQFTATGNYSDGTSQVITAPTWSSSATAVATVNSTGLVKSVSTGNTVITATFNGVAGNTALTVTAAKLLSISVTSASTNVAAGLTQQFTATGNYSDGTSQVITAPTWSSSTTTVAIINSTGVVKSLSTGSSVITAAFAGLTGSATLNVTAATLQSITVAPKSTSIAAGLIQQFVATGNYSDGTSQMIASPTWSSSANTVATVNSVGLVKSVSAGNVVITATFNGIAGNTNLTVTAATLQSITVTPASASIAAGLTQPFVATGNYSDGTSQVIVSPTWSSSAITVATVSSAGFVTSIKTGSAVIAATANGITGSATLVVTAAVLQSISVTPVTVSIAAGLTQQLTATGHYSDGTSQVIPSPTWSSSNTSVATVSSTGLVTSIKSGSTTITATINGFASSGSLTVNAAVLQSITVTPLTTSIAAGLTQQFTATGHYSDGTSQAISSPKWSSSNTSIATISSTGLATSLSTGTSTITVAYGGFTGGATLTVTAAVLQSITVAPPVASIAIGLTQQLTAIGHYSDGTSQAIPSPIWSSSNNSIATVSSTGLVTSIKTGSATITATVNGIAGSATQVVTSAILQSITVTPASASVPKAYTQQFVATGNYSDGTSQVITSPTWAVVATPIAVATITSSGLVTSVTSGTATINAAFGGLTGSTTLTVTSATPTSIVIVGSTATIPSYLYSGSNLQLEAIIEYSDGSHQVAPVANTIWSYVSGSGATINSSGLLSASSSGITVFSTSVNGLSSNMTITVRSGYLQSISMTPTTANVAAGQTEQLTVMGHYSDGGSQALVYGQLVTWSSSNNSIATVSSTGLVRAISSGTVVISALNGPSYIAGDTVTATITVP